VIAENSRRRLPVRTRWQSPPSQQGRTAPSSRRFFLAKTAVNNDLPRMEFTNVTALAKANVYFDGNVVSHTILLDDGTKKTLGLIRPGSYHFGTAAAERMEITDGACEVRLDGAAETAAYQAGTRFDVPANSGFTITVAAGLCQYVCSFLP
jgi:uncharacterized protein YaiE (UPF0345 family)